MPIRGRRVHHLGTHARDPHIDRLLGLSAGTARRWIDGYTRGNTRYPPVVRVEPTGEEVVTWGEFVETRLLSEYRDAGVPVVRMREQFHPRYPLAHARPFIDTEGRELVLRVQEDVGLDRELRLVVVRNDQIVLLPAAQQFVDSAEFDPTTSIVERLRPLAEVSDVVIDPLRQFGEPVVRSVRTDAIAEQIRAGETIDGIAELYEHDRRLVESALRYELICGTSRAQAA